MKIVAIVYRRANFWDFYLQKTGNAATHKCIRMRGRSGCVRRPTAPARLEKEVRNNGVVNC